MASQVPSAGPRLEDGGSLMPCSHRSLQSRCSMNSANESRCRRNGASGGGLTMEGDGQCSDRASDTPLTLLLYCLELTWCLMNGVSYQIIHPESGKMASTGHPDTGREDSERGSVARKAAQERAHRGGACGMSRRWPVEGGGDCTDVCA